MPSYRRPVLSACAATAMAAALTATTILPATAVPTVPPSPPNAEAPPAETAAEVKGEDQQILEIAGIDPEALPETALEDAAAEEAPTEEEVPGEDAAAEEVPAEDAAAEEAPAEEAPAEEAPEDQEPTAEPLALGAQATTVSRTSTTQGDTAAVVPPAVAEKATAQTDAPTAPEVEQLAESALPEQDTEQVAALSTPAETIDFIVAGLTWDISDAGQITDASVRVREESGWTDWESLEVHAVDKAMDTDRTGTEPLVTTGADAVQVRVTTEDGQVPEGLKVSLIDPGTAETDGQLEPGSPAAPLAQDAAEAADAAPAASANADAANTANTAEFVPALHQQNGLLTGTAEATTASTSNALKPAIITRSQWGANESWASNSRVSSQLKAMYVHHTAGTNNYTRAGAYQQIRGIYSYHARDLRWGDIGYQFLVDKFGNIYEGRRGSMDRLVIGAQAGGFNTNTIGVSAMGNYDVAAAPAVMVEALKKVLAWQGHRHGLNAQGTTVLTSGGGGSARYPAGRNVTVPVIVPHRDTNLTACPGRYLISQLGGIRSDVAKRISAGNAPAPAPVQPPATPTTPSNAYELLWAGSDARVRWNPVSGASHYQIMFRAAPHGGGSIRDAQWQAGRTTTDTTLVLGADPGETAQFAVRAVRNGVPGPQAYLGQHTGPVAWDSSYLHFARMTKVSSTSGVNGQAVRFDGRGAVLRVEGTAEAERLVIAAHFPSGSAHFDVYQDNDRYAGTIKIPSRGSAFCSLNLPGGSNVRLVSQNDTPVTLTRLTLTGDLQTRHHATSDHCQTTFTDNPPGSQYSTAIDWMQWSGITYGYQGDNTFRKHREISRGESVAFIHRYVKPSHSPRSTSPFGDVARNSTFYAPISWAADTGITKGYQNGTFGVHRNVTRGEFAAFLYRAADPSFSAPRTAAFKDVPRSNTHHTAIAWMKAEGLSGGYTDGTFRSGKSITRGEVATILHRYDSR